MKNIQWKRGIMRLYVVVAICWVSIVVVLAGLDAQSWPKAQAHDLGEGHPDVQPKKVTFP
jgi:hypothetical protein